MAIGKCALYALALCTLAATSGFAGDWTITNLGALPGPYDFSSGGSAINDAGEVVGVSSTRLDNHPVYFANGTVVDLGNLGGTYSNNPPYRQTGQALDINNHGTIVGFALTAQNQQHAFVFSNAVMSDLGTLGGADSRAMAINDSGIIVGQSSTALGVPHGFVYQNGVMTDIGGNVALDVNNRAEVVGTTRNSLASDDQGFLYHDGVTLSLGKGHPYSINDNGFIVGQTVGTTFEELKAAYYEDGSWHSLGTLGGVTSTATSVNNRDQIVGYSDVRPGEAGGLAHGFLYSNGVMTNVNSLIDPALGWSDLFAWAINDRGQITGSGKLNGQWSAIVLTPEMSTFALDVNYGDPSLVSGVAPLSVSADGTGLPGDVSVKFLLEGIADNPGAFRLEDVASALVSLDGLTWTVADLTSFRMTLGPGGVNDILSLSYAFAPFFTSDGLELTIHDDQFRLQVGIVDPTTQQSFDYLYGESMQTLAVVPEPTSLTLVGIALLAFVCVKAKRRG